MDDKPTTPKASKADVQPPAAAPAKKLTADELVKKHLEEVGKLEAAQLPENHMLLSEHIDASGLADWERRTLLARFHAHGLNLRSRIHPDVFKAAVNAALYERI